MKNTGTSRITRTTSPMKLCCTALLVLPILAPVLNAGDPGAEELWSDVRINESYIDYTISLGNNGSMLFSDTGFTSTNSRLYSTNRETTGDTVWAREDGQMQSFFRSAASSEEADVFAVVRHQGTLTSNRRAHLDVFNSSSSSPLLSHDFSELDSSLGASWCHVSRDGRTVFGAFVTIGVTHLKRFQANSAGTNYSQTGDWTFGTFDVAESFGITRDLTLLYLGSNVKAQVFDLTSSSTSPIFSKYLIGGAEPTGHSLSSDGNMIAIPMQDRVEILVRSGNTYVLGNSIFPFGTGTGQVAYRTALSADGRTLAAAYYVAPSQQVVTVLAWDLGQGVEILRGEIGGSGQYVNRPEDLVMSEDGQRIAVALGGAEPGIVPGIVIFDRPGETTGNFQTYASFDRPGSVINLEMSADGYRLAVASKIIPQGTGYGEKVIEAINLGKDFDVRGNARQGNTVTFEFYPEAPQQGTGGAYLLSALNLENTPVSFPFGTLYLKRQDISFTWMGTVEANGSAIKTIGVQGNVGSTMYYQGFAVPERQLSKSYTSLTVLP